MARCQKPTDKLFSIAFDRNWRGHPPLTSGAARLVQERSYRLSMLFGDLLLVVAFWPLKGWNYRIEKDFLTPIWPQNLDIPTYIHPAPASSSSAEGLCGRAVIGTTVSWTPQAKGVVAEAFI
jgi:hypothetical protein